MKKKILALALSSVIAVSALAACSDEKKESKKDSKEDEKVETNVEENIEVAQTENEVTTSSVYVAPETTTVADSIFEYKGSLSTRENDYSGNIIGLAEPTRYANILLTSDGHLLDVDFDGSINNDFADTKISKLTYVSNRIVVAELNDGSSIVLDYEELKKGTYNPVSFDSYDGVFYSLYNFGKAYIYSHDNGEVHYTEIDFGTGEITNDLMVTGYTTRESDVTDHGDVVNHLIFEDTWFIEFEDGTLYYKEHSLNMSPMISDDEALIFVYEVNSDVDASTVYGSYYDKPICISDTVDWYDLYNEVSSYPVPEGFDANNISWMFVNSSRCFYFLDDGTCWNMTEDVELHKNEILSAPEVSGHVLNMTDDLILMDDGNIYNARDARNE